MPPARTDKAVQERRDKLANSYQSLLSEFSASDLHSVGNYSLGRLIGKGSFGKVYLAQHKLTNGSKVVLKSAKKDDANLAREIHHHRQFLHPHIARLYEVIVTESLVWLVLEYCPGDELYNYLLNHGRMDAAKVQKIFTQLVGAVSYVHGKGCVHRDLKLENILLDKHENVKLVDFGFTREYQGSTSYLQTWCGTVCYSAPEMLKGEKYAGEKVDVWSLGIILYALLCGELPFDDDDDTTTKGRILKEDPEYPDYLPEGAKELIKKLLSKRPLLRPTLSDILRDPWLMDHAPQQQEILKLQQPPPFSTPLEKDVLQRMRAAGVDIDMVIENVLSQRCDSLAGWWALLLEKEVRKEKRKERKRKERDAEAKSIRRLSAASGRLLAQGALLGEIHEGEEGSLLESPRSRGRRKERAAGNALQPPDLPKVTETKSPTPEGERSRPHTASDNSRSGSRPRPPPKDFGGAVRSQRTASRGSQSMLRVVTNNPDLLSPSYVPPTQRKNKIYAAPLRQQLAWVKHLFKGDAFKRAKSPNDGEKSNQHNGKIAPLGKITQEKGDLRELHRVATGPATARRKSIGNQRPELRNSQTYPTRPRINTASSTGSGTSARGKRTSLSPHTLTPHSSYRRPAAGLRGRKSTSSSVSSIRSTYKPKHQHTHSKASSTSSASIASPSGLSSASGSRLARSPHSSVKVLPSTPTTNIPSGIRFSRRPPPGDIGPLPTFQAEGRTGFGTNPAPSSPGLPKFARRKRSIFKGPMHHTGGSPSGFSRTPTGGSRSASVQGRPSGEMMPGLTEEDEEEEMEEYEEELQFGPELGLVTNHDDEVATTTHAGDLEPISPMSPILPGGEEENPLNAAAEALKGSGQPLTAEALAKLSEEEAQLEKRESRKSVESKKEIAR
ncbi:Putative serine/threonine-protein kinase, active [Septoria linicola]|uniref:Serine/threonine-protein kinase, active n=1 Tax=Septoria linicola TaxID=215465 RepID=A0A9Q9B5F0_9PEZI|nr:putative serine/threonine-protein kinase, active [Septoria linicola]USW57486.1 Putative serine/threonine-protein kinase, active [Septoria linicola]